MNKLIIITLLFFMCNLSSFADVIPVGYTSVSTYINKEGKKVKPTEEQIEEYQKAQKDYDYLINLGYNLFFEDLKISAFSI